MTEYLYGKTVRIGNTFTDVDGVVYDPDTISLSIFDAAGTVQETVTYAASEITRVSEGVYRYDHTISSTSTSQGYWIGVWTVTVTATSQVDVSEEQFYVRPANEKLYISVDEVKTKLMTSGVTMADDTIRNCIRGAMAEVNVITGRTFTNDNTNTEWFNTNEANINTVVNLLYLTKLPVKTVSSLKEYDTSKALVKTYEDDEYWIDTNGILELCESEFIHQRHRVECIYTYGYTAVPVKISKLCSVISQIEVMRSYMIEQDDKMTGFDVPGVGSIQLGETYMTAQLAIKELEDQKKILITEIGNMRNDVFVI